jgi:hypothetical protein
MKKYTVGSGQKAIQLTADISTLGLAASRAILVDLNSTSSGVSVAHSNDATGDIPVSEIGLPDDLKGKRLSIFTKVDITGNDVESRKKEFEEISASYELSNGDSGQVTFSDPQKTVDDNFLFAMVIKHIDLI